MRRIKSLVGIVAAAAGFNVAQAATPRQFSCKPEGNIVAEHQLSDKAFKRFSATLTMPEPGTGPAPPIFSIELQATDQDRRLRFMAIHDLPKIPGGLDRRRLLSTYLVETDSSLRPLNLSEKGLVEFQSGKLLIETVPGGGYAYSITYPGEDGKMVTQGATLSTAEFGPATVNLLCLGAPFELTDLSIES